MRSDLRCGLAGTLFGAVSFLSGCTNNLGDKGEEIAGSLPPTPEPVTVVENPRPPWNSLGSGNVYIFEVKDFAPNLDRFIEQNPRLVVTSFGPLTKVQTFGLGNQQTAASAPYAFLVTVEKR